MCRFHGKEVIHHRQLYHRHPQLLTLHMERETHRDLAAYHHRPGGLPGRRHLVCHPQHQRRPTGHRLCAAGAVFRGGRRENLRQLLRNSNGPRRPSRPFVRFALAQGRRHLRHPAPHDGPVQASPKGAVTTIMGASGLADTCPPRRCRRQMTEIIQDVGLLQSIPLWAVTLLGSRDRLGAVCVSWY